MYDPEALLKQHQTLARALRGEPLARIEEAKWTSSYRTLTYRFRRFDAEFAWSFDELKPGEWSWKLVGGKGPRIAQLRCMRCGQLDTCSIQHIRPDGRVQGDDGKVIARSCMWRSTAKIRCSLAGFFVFGDYRVPKDD